MFACLNYIYVYNTYILWLGISDQRDHGPEGRTLGSDSACQSLGCPQGRPHVGLLHPGHVSCHIPSRVQEVLGTLSSTPVFSLGVWRGQECVDLHFLLDSPLLGISETSV